MDPERWPQVKEILDAALKHPPDERAAFVSAACSGDEALYLEVESLLESYESAFLEQPAVGEFVEGPGGHQLAAGQIITHYRIISLLAVSGMGEVYLAVDTTLDRRVALKFLPARFTADADRLRRFEQEARAASALNHPNILTVYEIGEVDGRRFIATEFIDGETLRQAIVYGPLEVREALNIAEQIASALAEAHGVGIIHRDIKPDNIMLRRDRLLKVLDFGLAKLTEPASPMVAEVSANKVNTSSGMIMGTVGYMSPEQARGQTVDARSDIFNLGAVIYEMTAGQRPFEGETPSDVLAAILNSEPPQLTHSTPEVRPELVRIVAKALRKDRDQRYQSIKDMRLDLKNLKEEIEFQAKLDRSAAPRNEESATAARSQPLPMEETSISTNESKSVVSRITYSLTADSKGGHKTRAILAAIALVVATAAGVFALYKSLNRSRLGAPASAGAPQVLKTTQITFSTGLDRSPSLSPDGTAIAYSSDQNGGFEIYVKQLTPGGRDIQLTTDGQQNFEPAWAPDGQHIAYYSKSRGGIWLLPAFGGVAKQLTEFGSRPAWSHDGSMIAFQSAAPNEVGGSRNAMPPSTIWIVPSQGGKARQITQQGKPPGGHGAPAWSPDGKRILFDAGDVLSSSVWSVSLEGGELMKIAPIGSDAIYAPDGKSIYCIGEIGGSKPGLLTVRLSTATSEPIGEPEAVTDAGPGVIRSLSITSDGRRIAYSAPRISSNLWFVPLSKGSGGSTGVPASFARDTSHRNSFGRFSPNGLRFAFTRSRPGTSVDIWMADADGKNLTQLTSDPAADSQPSWFPEGNRIAFLSDRNNDHLALWSMTPATGREEPLLDLGPGVELAALSPDGKQVAFNSKKGGTINVWTAPLRGGEQKQLTFDNELMGFPCWSPDGKFIALEGKRGDDTYIFIIPSSGGTPVQLTFDHGQSWPHSWSPDGGKIAFAGQRNGIWNIYSVSVTTKQEKQLTHYSKLNAFARYPAWSPLGNQIIYEYAETTGNIWLMELK